MNIKLSKYTILLTMEFLKDPYISSKLFYNNNILSEVNRIELVLFSFLYFKVYLTKQRDPGCVRKKRS